MREIIFNHNLDAMANKTTIVVLASGLEPTDKLIEIIADFVRTGVEAWYYANLGRKFDVFDELVHPKALEYALETTMVALIRSGIKTVFD